MVERAVSRSAVRPGRERSAVAWKDLAAEAEFLANMLRSFANCASREVILSDDEVMELVKCLNSFNERLGETLENVWNDPPF